MRFFVGLLGLEPRTTGPKPAVLPLDDRVIYVMYKLHTLFYQRIRDFSIHPAFINKNHFDILIYMNMKQNKTTIVS